MKKRLTLLLTLLLLAPVSVSAHGSLFTYKYIDSGNVVMVTHNIDDIQAGVPVTYNLRLYDIDGVPVPYEDARATITQDEKTLAEATQPPSEAADVNFTYKFPRHGNYQLNVTFLDHDKQIAHGSFPIGVPKGVQATGLKPYYLPAATFLAGVAFTLLLVKFKHRLPKPKLPRRKKRV